MIHALEAVGVAWLMINVALFVAMKREDAMALSRRTIDRFWRAGCGAKLADDRRCRCPDRDQGQHRGAVSGRLAERGWIFNRPEATLLFVEQDTEKFGLPSHRANSSPKQLGSARGACPSFR
jgi:hypothetical protein